MMLQKMIYLFLFLATLLGCQNQSQKVKAPQEPLPVEETLTADNETILMGAINRANLLKTPYTQWFKEEYDLYRIPEGWSDALKPKMENVSIKLFMGTWCEDTQMYLGGIFKLLDALEFDESKLEMYALSEFKDSPQGFETGLDIYNIPTVIFYKNGKEMNRFVEFPLESLEADFQKIIFGEPYQNPYYEE